VPVTELLNPSLLEVGVGFDLVDGRRDRGAFQQRLLGAMTVTEAFVDQLRDGGGDLVNLLSVAGRTARPGKAVYAATKWGLNGWSESLRQELQPDVRVMVIEPGAVATELTITSTTPAPSRRRADVREAGHHRRGHRRGDHVRRHPSPAHDYQRDPRAVKGADVAGFSRRPGRRHPRYGGAQEQARGLAPPVLRVRDLGAQQISAGPPELIERARLHGGE
jgi:NAD(P)-dependent dehydrogenase (short-subunit alcohol dehydrogenase family)